MHNILSALNPAKLTGPIFTKELRVASRRRRNFVLRLTYVVLLLLFVAGVWGSFINADSTGDPQIIYKMSQMGKSIITTIAWFQFCALQLVAVVLASTSINQEVYSRSLGVLMTTPVTPWQIVFGKVLSKVAQIGILLAISMPVLAIVRIFGGVPWDFVLASICVTITAALFAASISMFYSSIVRPPYAVILLTLGTMFILYVIVMWFVGLVIALSAAAFSGFNSTSFQAVVAGNPFAVMGFLTLELNMPGTVSPPWIANCCVMLLTSVGLLSLTVPLVRRRALRSALGGTASYQVAMPAPVRPIGAPPSAWPIASMLLAVIEPVSAVVGVPAPPPLPDSMPAAQARAAEHNYRQQLAVQGYRLRKLRQIGDDPILWREIRTPLFRSAVWRWVIFGLSVAILAPLYLGMGAAFGFTEGFFHYVFCTMFAFCATGCSAVCSATGVTTEKESGSLPLILTTPINDVVILLGKAAGAVRRCAPVWAFLFTHAVIFSLVLTTNPLIVVHMALIACGTIVFLTGSGLYCSCRFRKTTSAVVANLGLALVLWVLLPIAGAMIGPNDWSHVINPVYQAGSFAGWAAEHGFIVKVEYPGYMQGAGALTATAEAGIFCAAYAAAGGIFFWRARRHLRRNVF